MKVNEKSGEITVNIIEIASSKEEITFDQSKKGNRYQAPS
jgi:hypothetical protein